MTEPANQTHVPDRGDELAERIVHATTVAMEVLNLHLGARLGLYDVIREHDGVTVAELATGAGIDPRYAREWLEQQAVAAYLDVDDPTAPAAARRYRLPAGAADVLTDPESLRFVTPATGFVVGAAIVIEDLLTAFRTGGGVPYARYGAAVRDAQGAYNRPLFTKLLTQEWLPVALPDLHERLRSSPDARVADLGCGVGWSTIALARAYPDCVVEGFDGDAASIAEATKHAAAAGSADRLTFRVHDASEPLPAGAYDAVFVFEALHDMAQPVAALAAARAMLKPGGVCVVMDERVSDEFTAPGDEVERFMYAVSVLHCLPAGLADQPSAGTGTVLRRSILERYAAEAGYSSVVTLPVEHEMLRLYRLEP